MDHELDARRHQVPGVRAVWDDDVDFAAPVVRPEVERGSRLVRGQGTSDR